MYEDQEFVYKPPTSNESNMIWFLLLICVFHNTFICVDSRYVCKLRLLCFKFHIYLLELYTCVIGILIFMFIIVSVLLFYIFNPCLPIPFMELI